jgi:N6-L-threonylcarbamoyladenine synthase
VEKIAKLGNPHTFDLPKAKMTNIPPALSALRQLLATDEQFAKYSYDYSFSGLKTAVLRLAQAQIGEDYSFPSIQLAGRLNDQQKADIAASFQRVAVETVVDKTYTAYQEFKPATVIIGGGVASSPALREMLAERLPIAIDYADRKLCTDNGAMIAALGCFKMKLGQPTADPYTLDIKPNLSM